MTGVIWAETSRARGGERAYLWEECSRKGEVHVPRPGGQSRSCVLREWSPGQQE